MDVIAEIKQKLFKYPHLKYSVTADAVTIEAPSTNGFSVALTVENGGYTVYFDGWHESFKSGEEALNCFAFGLSDQCRLKVERRGRMENRWILESFVDNTWQEESQTGCFIHFG